MSAGRLFSVFSPPVCRCKEVSVTPMLHAVTCLAFLSLCIDFRPPFPSLCIHFRSIFHQSLCSLPVYFFSVYASTSVLSFRSLYIRFWSVCLPLIYAFIPRLFSFSPCIYFRSNLSPCTNFRSNLLQSMHQLPG